MPSFECQVNESVGFMQVLLKADFTADKWDEFERHYGPLIAKGVVNWDLNLTEMQWINSVFLGLLVGLNTMLSTRGGRLRVLVPRKSKIADILFLAKLNRILNIHEQ
ncbi:MAG: STAS domain-containing protein [bacterium]|nr:STAS domain-containing protein [bacterium]